MNKIILYLLVFSFLLYQSINLRANIDTYISTSNITYNEETRIVELAENSKINIENTNILVDRGIIDYNKDTLEVFGNFYLYQELNILSGENLKGNTNLTKFTANEVSYIYNEDLKIDSEMAERSDGIIYFYNNFLTPCKLDGFFNCPTWSFRIDKTKYEIDEDRFIHYDSFLQIADYKVFYLPYFSHYGHKAPRKKGFLTPTIEFVIGGDTSVTTPYYYPIKENTEVIFKPKIIFDDNFEFINNFNSNTKINHKNNRGDINIDIYNQKKQNEENLYTSAKLNTKQTLNKNNILSVEALMTNSISTTRSINDEPLAFEDIFIKLDSYDVFYETDFMRSKLSTVEALDTTDSAFVPLAPSINYNQQNIFSNFTLNNSFEITNLRRDESNVDKPSDITYLKVNNTFLSNLKKNNLFFYNKFILSNNLSNYSFEHNSDLNNEANESNTIFSSDIFFSNLSNIKPRIKFIHNQNLFSDNIINEDSKAITFNYQNLFSESRIFGEDLQDNSSRFIYGIEYKYNIEDKNFFINFGQSYDLEKNTNYTNLINQNSNLSDVALEAKTKINEFDFKLDTRLDRNRFSKKEMNYSLNYSSDINFNMEYNETDSTAFDALSSDTKSMKVGIGKSINDNLALSFSSNLDLKNEYSPYSQSINLNLQDECSRLELRYTDSRFNDNYNTQPNETISINFYMDYIGFFGYEQKTNLLFEEAGNFNYGL